MTRSRRRLRLLLALGPALLAALVGIEPALGQQPGPEASAGPAQLELVSRPAWARPVDQLTFALRSTGDPAATSVQVEVFSALDSVEELEDSATADEGVRLSLTPPVPVAELPPGPDGTRTVTIRVAADPTDDRTTQIIAPGVHPVVISLLGPGGQVLDEVRTPVVRLGEEEDPWQAPDLAVLLDLDASPTLEPDGTRTLPPAELRRLGRTAAVLAAHPDLGLTVAAVPDTVEALATASDRPQAAAVLDAVRSADLLVAPYLPLPVAELVEHRLDGLVAPLVDRGTAVLADPAGELRHGVWAGTTPIGNAGGRVLDQLGFERVVVPAPVDEDDDDLVPIADSGPRALRGAGPLLALLADPNLSAELASPLPQRPDAAHVVLARYLLRPAEDDPSDTTDDRDDDGEQDSATVLVRPGALAERSQLAGLLELLDDPESPVRVGGLDLVDDRPDEPEPDDSDDVEPVTWSPEASADLDSVAPRVLAVAGRLESFAAMVADRTAVADDLRLQVATAVATGTDDRARDEAMESVEGALAAGFEGVHLTGQTDLNLTSRRGTLPVTVENLNPYAVDVLVRVRSDRLRLPEGDAVPLTIGEGEQRRIDVPVEARATGSVPVFVELRTPDDELVLDELRLNVRSTAVTGVGLVISAGAIVVLLTWWIRHVRHVRRDRRSGPDDAAMG